MRTRIINCITFSTALLFLLFISVPARAVDRGERSRGVMIEDFEDGEVTLHSYSTEQDEDPDAWAVTDEHAYESVYSLVLWGNTWKAEDIEPRLLERGTVWQIAVCVGSIGEMHAFGLTDGTNELFYTFAGEQLPVSPHWRVDYQGYATLEEWRVYLLPVGDDWFETFEYDPLITSIFYINDDDDPPVDGVTFFDEIWDVTEDQPIEPLTRIRRSPESAITSLHYSFHAGVYDPDSPHHTFLWQFGDGDTASGAFTDHFFEPLAHTVGVSATDGSGRVGHHAIHLDCGPDTGDLKINFVGDVMMARRYEGPGGIIPTYGVEYIFEFTRDIFGDAADLSVCNLECPLTDEGEPHPTKSIVFRGKPKYVAGLEFAGIDAVALGNNHIYDYLDRGLERTTEVLDSVAIRHSGAGMELYEALQPTFLSHGGIRLGLLSFCERTGIDYNEQPFFFALPSKPGFARATEQYMAEAIPRVRDWADFVVVQIHAGTEYAFVPERGRASEEWGGTGQWDSLPLLRASPSSEEGLSPGARTLYRDRIEYAGAWLPVDPLEWENLVRFPSVPDSGVIELKHRAVDLGADLLICHHPHVLQGIEIYNGTVIAHSMGNFAFDQEYFETFPTIILTCTIDRSGLTGCSFVPVYIDDYVPTPATGSLAANIIRRMADLSRAMGTIIVADEEMTSATIALDTTAVTASHLAVSGSVPLVPAPGDTFVSHPWAPGGPGDLSRIDSVVTITPAADAEVRIGKDILWFGDFELEGATIWNLNSGDEWLDSTMCHHGMRSLALRRAWDAGDNVITDLQNRPPIDSERGYTLMGWLRADNAADASFMAVYYETRFGGPMGKEDACEPFTGTQDWTFCTRDLEVPEEAGWVNVRGSNDAPEADTGYVWFDELVLIEWSDWLPADEPVAVDYPNNYTHLQFRTTTPIDSVRFDCTVTSLSITENEHALPEHGSRE
jgi:poly-gamma-glutamate capsule biosynthesis protein CapA/YwtB (metallophosphatase superfamily)